PDNPSGNLLSKAELLTLLEWSKRKGIQLLIDESFLDFAREDDTYSLFNKELLSQNPHLVVIKSISKSFGVPGLRLGFLATGDLQLIQRLRKEISIWNINSFAEFYMQIFIKYREDYKKARIKFIEERKRFFQCLQHINYLRVIPSAANYFLCEVVGKYTTEDICSILLANHNILLKNCSTKAGFNQAQYIRMAIRNQKENDKLIAALASLND
ncbi:MAG: aminotransferase class I/II-fold pyridoxal phosphate-dependent enzyme, partial [Parabacteroides sp.]